MKKMFPGLLGLSFIGFIVFSFFNHPIAHESSILGASPTAEPTKSILPTLVTTNSQVSKTLFVPSWTIDGNIPHDYDQYVYFGVSADTNGIDRSDSENKDIDMFLKNTPANAKRLLTIQMVDSSVNATVLSSIQAQKNIATESAALASEKGFDGVVLDFEISAISFDSVVKNISGFTHTLSQEVHKDNLTFYTTIYGDTFYRLRPYDISALDNDVDGFFVMAYDFHKANGNDPGPNFPLIGKDTYGYDFETMTADFLKHTTPQKLTIVFGLYGYNWQLDDKKQTVGTAMVVTDAQAQSKFYPCLLTSCSVSRDTLSAETHVTYQDSKSSLHDVWFEDMTSVKKKTEFLQSKGINSIGYWAYSYF